MISVISVVTVAVDVLSWLIIARVILSWVRHDPSHPLIRFVYEITEPILAPIRRVTPRNSIIDFSPLIAILILYFIQWGLIQIIR